MTVPPHNLPRGLDPSDEAQFIRTDTNGYLQIGIRDGYGWGAENTPNDEVRVITPYRVVGSTFTGTTLDSNFWTPNTGTGGTASIANGQLTLSTGTTINNTTNVQSVRSARYIGGSSNRARIILRLPDTGTTANTRRWGAYSASDGCFFELTGTDLGVVTRKGSSDDRIDNADLNGDTFTLNTNVNTYEIYYNNSRVYFVVNGSIIHTHNATTTTWSDTLNLPLRFDNNNTNNGASNVSMQVRNAVITRLGEALTDPIYKNIKTATTTICKYGPGKLHSLMVNGTGSVGNTATLYDYAASPATGSIIATVDLNKTGIAGFNYNVPFFTGLAIVTNSTVDLTAIYE